MNKLQNVTVRVTKTTNPYRVTSFKYHIFKECLVRQTFTKEEFGVFLLEIKAKYEVTSKMSDEVLVKAWWNEFTNKHHDFELAQ